MCYKGDKFMLGEHNLKHDKMQVKEECVMECVCVQWILQNKRWDDDIEAESDRWREPGGIAIAMTVNN